MAKTERFIPRMGQVVRFLPQAEQGHVAPYRISCCVDDHVHVEIGDIDAGAEVTEIIFADPDDAYKFAHSILRAYDVATGIVPPER